MIKKKRERGKMLERSLNVFLEKCVHTEEGEGEREEELCARL